METYQEPKSRQLARNVLLPLAAVFETIATAKATQGQHTGQTALGLMNVLDQQNRFDIEQREKAIERASQAAERKADRDFKTKEFKLKEDEQKESLSLKKLTGGREEAEFQAKEDKDHRALVEKDKAIARMLGIESSAPTLDESTNTITMGQKSKPGLSGLSDIDKEFIRQDPMGWLEKQIAQKKEFAPPKPASGKGAAAGGKILPISAVQDLSERSSAADIFAGLRTDFKPDYGGYKTQIAGDAANWAKRTFGDKSGQAQWWQTYQEQKNIVRHKFFGSALTVTEKGEFDKAQINPAMDPGQISLNLQRQEDAIRKAAAKLESAYQSSGYKTPGLTTWSAPSDATNILLKKQKPSAPGTAKTYDDDTEELRIRAMNGDKKAAAFLDSVGVEY